MLAKKRQRDKGNERESELENFIFGADDNAECDEVQDTENMHADTEDVLSSEQQQQQQQLWQDDDDEEMRIDVSRVDRLKKLRPNSNRSSSLMSGSELTGLMQQRFQSRALAWSRKTSNQNIENSDEEPEEEDDEVLRSTGGVLRGGDKSSASLPGGGSIDIKRLVDANAAAPTKLSINAVQFDASGRVLMTAGCDKAVRMFAIDGETNENILNVRFADMPIEYARFCNDGTQLLVAGRRPYFYSYDVASGNTSQCTGLIAKDKGLKSCELMQVSPAGSRIAIGGAGGYVHILCGRTKTWVTDIKMNCGVRSLTFLGEDRLVTAGIDADVYEWDLRTLHRPKCLLRFHNQDGSAVSCLAAHSSTGSSAYQLAAGSESGVVSVYSGDVTSSEEPKMVRSMMNLTTKITTLAIHPSGSLLALASDHVLHY